MGHKLSSYTTLKWVTACLVAAVTAVIFLPALQNGFINWDDDLYVFNNPYIQSISLSSLKWMFTAFHAYNWHPLTWFSHAMDYQLWGLNPLGHHLTNIIFHALNSLLVVFITFKAVEIADAAKLNALSGEEKRRFTIKALIAAAVAGLLFGLHPVHVESVAWVSERKDVQCSFFYLLSIIAYISYAAGTESAPPPAGRIFTETGRGKIYYWLSLSFFAAALLSKPMAVTLPAVLFVLDIYPLKRLGTGRGLRSISYALKEKIPFIALSALVSALTVSAQQLLVKEYSQSTRLLVSLKSFGFYLLKLLLPLDLAPLYPYPHNISFGDPGVVVSLILLIGIAAICLISWRKSGLFFSVWAYFIFTLLPIIGIIQVGKQAAADRYMYLPGISLFILAGLAVAWAWDKADGKNSYAFFIRSFLVVFISVIVTTLSFLTTKQIAFWKDTITLFSYELEIFPDYPDAYTIRGLNYREAGDYKKAIEDFNKSILLNSSYAPVYQYRGSVYEKTGNYEEAVRDFNMALQIDPEELTAYSSRGDVFFKLGDYERALKDYEKVVELNYRSWEGLKARGIDPNEQYAMSHYKLASVNEKLGDYRSALKSLDRVIEIFPRNAEAYNKRGVIFRTLGDYNRALNDFNNAINYFRGYMEAYNNRAGILAVMGNYQEAIRDLNKAIELNPSSIDAYVNRGMLYLNIGSHEPAVRDFQAAARMGDSQSQDYLNSKGIAW